MSRKAKALNEWYELREGSGLFGVDMPADQASEMQPQRIRWKVKADEERESLAKMIGISCYRPFRALPYTSAFADYADEMRQTYF